MDKITKENVVSALIGGAVTLAVAYTARRLQLISK
jgi:pyridoxamine 5'-phosphate oxidase